MSAPGPFPYDAIPAISREEVRTTARLREVVTTFVRPEVLAHALGEIAGESLSITARRTIPLEATRIPALGVGVAFSPSDAPGMSRAVLVDVESALAAKLVAKALRQREPRVVDGTRAPSLEIAGALAALLHAALRRAHKGVPLRVASAGPAPAIAREIAAVHGRVATLWLAVVLGEDSFDVRVSVPLAELPPVHEARALTRETLESLDALPMALPLVVATCAADRALLAAVAPGDVFVVPGFPLRLVGGAYSSSAREASSLIGPVALVGGAGERGLAGELAEGGRLVLRTDRVESCPWDITNEKPMPAEGNATIDVLEDAPVVVRVELGSVEMKAREWAALASGDVLTLGRRLGDPAILRVGGVEVARGELVQVDGEYGVRILRTSGTR